MLYGLEHENYLFIVQIMFIIIPNNSIYKYSNNINRSQLLFEKHNLIGNKLAC